MAKYIYPIIIVLFIALAPQTVQGQNYQFSFENTAYQELENPVEITDLYDSLYYFGVPLSDFPNFPDYKLYNMKMSWDTITFGRGGFVLVASADQNHVIAIDPFVTDLQPVDETSSLSHGLQTIDGRINYTIQWKNFELVDLPGKFMNFQIQIEGGTDNISFHYGPANTDGANTTDPGIQVGIFQLPADFSRLEKMRVVSGNASSPSSSITTFGYVQTYPSAGMRYTFDNTFTTSTSTFTASEIQVYPNPTNGNLYIDLDKTYDEVQVVVTDLHGKRVYDQVYSGTHLISENLNLLSGVYFVQLYSHGVHLGNYKIIGED